MFDPKKKATSGSTGNGSPYGTTPNSYHKKTKSSSGKTEDEEPTRAEQVAADLAEMQATAGTRSAWTTPS